MKTTDRDLLVSIERLNNLLRYDPETGDLIWRERLIKMKRGMVRSKYAGKVAGCIFTIKKGYQIRVVNITPADGVRPTLYVASRVIWTMVNGPIPDGRFVDHINKDPMDNRLSNLRLADRFENSYNSGKRNHNTSGYKGVHKSHSRWMSVIMIKGERICKMHPTPIEAALHYDRLAELHQGDFAHLNFPLRNTVDYGW